ncbi:MAG: cation transporter [Verrucomicrobiaceae bacterium]|nr:cation transporter [Verrucomicrobiaceae bacterium]
MKAKHAGILSAVLGSVCCVAPLILVALGVGAGAAVIGRYHWFFIGGAIAVLAWAWPKHIRERNRCACEHRVMDGRRISFFTLLFASAVVFSFAALNVSSYVFAGPPPPRVETGADNLQRVVIPVEGMSCSTCEVAVRTALQRTSGVKAAHVSVATKNATIDYEPATTNPAEIVKAINSTGYTAALPRE